MFKPDDEFMAAYERAEEKELCHASKDDDEEASRKRRRNTALAIGGGVAAGAAITAAVMGRRSGGATPSPIDSSDRQPGRVYRVSTAKPGLRSGQRAQYERAGLKVGATYRAAKTAGSKPHPEFRYTSTKPRLSEEARARAIAKEARKKLIPKRKWL